MDNAQAGPSAVIDPALCVDSVSQDIHSSTAPLRPLPSTHFYSIEYPGYVKPTSVSLALERLGGQLGVDAAFKRTGSKSGSLLEMNMRPGNPFAHPVPGEVVSTNNILFKIVKRKRKRRDAEQPSQLVGEYTAHAMGIIPKTVRFRSRCLSCLE